MAKFQLCMFRREPPPHFNPKLTVLPAKLEGWERGIAKVENFGTGDVEFIVDENGEKLKKAPYNYKLLSSYAHTTLDTNAEGT